MDGKEVQYLILKISFLECQWRLLVCPQKISIKQKILRTYNDFQKLLGDIIRSIFPLRFQTLSLPIYSTP